MPAIKYVNKDGKRLSGVTTIISGNLGWNKQPLMYWANQMGLEGKSHREEMEKAADAGTLAHQMIEAELKGAPMPSLEGIAEEISDKANTALGAWREWKDLVEFELIASEVSLVSEEYQFGGTIDVAAIKKVPCILDLKTSNGIYPDHRIQVSAYGKLWNENRPEKLIGAYYINQLGKDDGSFHYHYWPALEREWEAFLHLKALHELKKEIGK